jgi:hypothetical protein
MRQVQDRNDRDAQHEPSSSLTLACVHLNRDARVCFARTGGTGQVLHFRSGCHAATGTVLYSRTPDAGRRTPDAGRGAATGVAYHDDDAVPRARSLGRLRLSYALPISRRASRQPATHLGIAAGRLISVRNARDAVAAVLSNDVAVAFAEKHLPAR